MKYIMLKTFRDIRETIGSFISILIIIFIGCLFFAGAAEGSSAMTNQAKDYYAAQNYATERAEYMYVNSAAVNKIQKTEGVINAAGYDSFYTKTRVNGMRYDISIRTLTDGIDEPRIMSGRLPEDGKREILIDSVFAKEHNITEGARLTFDIATLKAITLSEETLGSGETTFKYDPEYDQVGYTFTVCGTYHSPDIVYKVNIMNTAARPEDFIMAYVRHGEISSYRPDAVVKQNGTIIFSYTRIPSDITVYTGITVITDGSVDAEKMFKTYSMSNSEELQHVLVRDPRSAAGLYMYCLDRKNFPSVTAFNGINDTIAAIAAVLPIIFFAVAAAITIIALSKTVDNQRMQIGVIQALGISKGAVYFSYIFYALFACLIGGFAGGLAGTFFIPYLLYKVYATQFSMPPLSWHVGGGYMVLGVVISAALACLSAYLSCYKTLRVAPAQAMRPKPPKKTKRILVERWKGLWKRLNFRAKMNLRNMFLHKWRMLLSSVGIIGCIALLIGLVGLKDNMQYSFKRYDATTNYDLALITEKAVDPKEEDIKSFTAEAGAEYVEKLTFVPEFSGRFTYGDNTADLSVMALPTKADEKKYAFSDHDCLAVYTDVEGRKRVEFDDDTFVIPQLLAKKLGVKAGDTVRVTGYSLDNLPVEFEIKISAVACEFFEQKAYCSYAVFEKNGVGLKANTSYAKLKAGASADTAISALKSHEAVRDVKSFAETFAALKKQMSLLDYAVIIFVVGAAALAIAVIYNITATNLKDRTREMATLMVLGSKSYETAGMVLAENLVITALGCLLGLPLGYGLLMWLVNLTASFNVFISGFMSWYVSIGCLGLTFAFSLLATLLLSTKIKNISMVEALKSVE